MKLESAFQNSNHDIIGLAEVRREGEYMKKTKADNLCCYIGTHGSQRRVRFLIMKSLSHKLMEFKGITDILALGKFNLSKHTLSIIQEYAPIASRRLQSTYNSMERAMLGLKLRDKVGLKKITKKSNLTKMLYFLQKG